ncbi:hypothetical protein MUK42_35664 [Musa troglodytarum]|uniref:Uncharacterized protein n=1 Tax=Musa troglodytarum TaxID=320322 RepID=A0A9E7GAF2_9LILI|nr:hypothetical protein MUK42_35664 [Musa troglodytarum]
MNLSPLNLSVNLSFMPLLNPDPVPSYLDDPDPRGNDEENRTSLVGKMEVWGSREVATRAMEEAAARKAVKTSAFFISERSPSSIVIARRTFKCRYRLSSPHLLDIEGCKREDEEKKDEATMMRRPLKQPVVLVLAAFHYFLKKAAN